MIIFGHLVKRRKLNAQNLENAEIRMQPSSFFRQKLVSEFEVKQSRRNFSVSYAIDLWFTQFGSLDFLLRLSSGNRTLPSCLKSELVWILAFLCIGITNIREENVCVVLLLDAT